MTDEKQREAFRDGVRIYPAPFSGQVICYRANGNEYTFTGNSWQTDFVIERPTQPARLDREVADLVNSLFNAIKEERLHPIDRACAGYFGDDPVFKAINNLKAALSAVPASKEFSPAVRKAMKAYNEGVRELSGSQQPAPLSEDEPLCIELHRMQDGYFKAYIKYEKQLVSYGALKLDENNSLFLFYGEHPEAQRGQ